MLLCVQANKLPPVHHLRYCREVLLPLSRRLTSLPTLQAAAKQYKEAERIAQAVRADRNEKSLAAQNQQIVNGKAKAMRDENKAKDFDRTLAANATAACTDAIDGATMNDEMDCKTPVSSRTALFEFFENVYQQFDHPDCWNFQILHNLHLLPPVLSLRLQRPFLRKVHESNTISDIIFDSIFCRLLRRRININILNLIRSINYKFDSLFRRFYALFQILFFSMK